MTEPVASAPSAQLSKLIVRQNQIVYNARMLPGVRSLCNTFDPVWLGSVALFFFLILNSVSVTYAQGDLPAELLCNPPDLCLPRLGTAVILLHPGLQPPATEPGVGTLAASITGAANIWTSSESISGSKLILDVSGDLGLSSSCFVTGRVFRSCHVFSSTIKNESPYTWIAFDIEVQSSLGFPSSNDDGLSFGDLGPGSVALSGSDRFGGVTPDNVDRDVLHFTMGEAKPGETVSFTYFIANNSFSRPFYIVHRPAAILVAIDIKPGEFPNSINAGSRGTVPVAILSSPNFDARTVDPTTVTLAGAPVQLDNKGVPKAFLEDVNRDGLLDLVVHVSTDALQLSAADTEAVLSGKLFDGTAVSGKDTVRVAP